MKKCPTCDKEFADSMRFCQTDGTVLVEKVDAPPDDPYKTVVGNQSDIASAMPPLDPFKTMVAGPPPKIEDDLLQIPDEPDSMKTLVVSKDELKAELKSGKSEEASPLDLPPPAQYAPSAPLIEPKPKGTSNASPTPPKANEPFSTPPNFGEMSASKTDDDQGAATAIMDSVDVPPAAPSPFDSKPFENDFSGKSPYGNQDSKPIPSPFDLSMPPGYMPPPMTNPFDEPKPPVKDFAEPNQSPSNPFDAPTPFGQSDPFNQPSYNQPLQQTEWTPPPAPDASWQSQNIGANTPFQPPVAGGSSGQGQNQTMALVSLILGIVGIVICQLTGPAALITGFMARKKIAQNPNEYGGGGLALAGMIMGGIGTLLLVLVILYFILVIGLAASGSRF